VKKNKNHGYPVIMRIMVQDSLSEKVPTLVRGIQGLARSVEKNQLVNFMKEQPIYTTSKGQYSLSNHASDTKTLFLLSEDSPQILGG
jgi:hypothetical protein